MRGGAGHERGAADEQGGEHLGDAQRNPAVLGTAQDVVRPRLIAGREHRGGNHHAEQQHQKSHNILVVQDGGAHAGIDLKGFFHFPVHLHGPALCRRTVRLFHRHQGGDPGFADGIVAVNFLRIDLHDGGGHAGVWVGKCLFDTVEQRGDRKDFLLIDALRQVVGLRDAVGCEAGLINLHGLPHPLRGDNAAGIRLALFFIGDGSQSGQVDLIPGLIRVAAVTVGRRQIGQQDGEDQRQRQQNPGKPCLQDPLQFQTKNSHYRTLLSCSPLLSGNSHKYKSSRRGVAGMEAAL